MHGDLRKNKKPGTALKIFQRNPGLWILDRWPLRSSFTGINQLQAAGWVPATPLDFPPAVPVLGIYPTTSARIQPKWM
jgi:hypothetical protein